MAITFFGAASTPTDNGANTTDPTVITPPASMAAGDLVVVYAAKRAASIASMSVSQAGGQSWTISNIAHASSTATLGCVVYYCIFNGTWSANPSFNFGATVNNTAVMIVFRPTNSSNTWAVDTGNQGSASSFAAAATITNTGWTPSNASTVSLAFWNTDDDNTWGTLTGSGWIQTGLSAQYRNTSGSDSSIAAAYKILTSAAALGNVSLTEATLGNDPGIQSSISFYEIASGPNSTPGTGVLTIAGFAPSASVTNNQNVTPGVGVLSISGFAPTVFATDPKEVLPGVGVLTISAFAPSVSVSDNKNILADTGALSISGFAPSAAVSDNKNILAGVGSLSVTGFAPSVDVTTGGGVNVSPSTGDVQITGFAPIISTPVNTRVNTGQLTIAGFAPIVFASDNKIIQPATGQILFEGFAPAWSGGSIGSAVIEPGTGQLIIIGYAPTFIEGVTMRLRSHISDALNGESIVTDDLQIRSSIPPIVLNAESIIETEITITSLVI